MAGWWQGMNLRPWGEADTVRVASFEFAQAVAEYRTNHRVHRQQVRRDGLAWLIADTVVVAEPCS